MAFLTKSLKDALGYTFVGQFFDDGLGNGVNPVQLPKLLLPQSWNGASFDGTLYSGIEFQVIGTPSSAYTPQRSLDGATWVNITVIDQNGASVTSITAAGLYTIKGRCNVRLNGGAGSTLYIAGEQ